jgi:hypothetical protein
MKKTPKGCKSYLVCVSIKKSHLIEGALLRVFVIVVVVVVFLFMHCHMQNKQIKYITTLTIAIVYIIYIIILQLRLFNDAIILYCTCPVCVIISFPVERQINGVGFILKTSGDQ